MNVAFWQEISPDTAVSQLSGRSMLLLPTDHGLAQVMTVTYPQQNDWLVAAAPASDITRKRTISFTDGPIGPQLHLIAPLQDAVIIAMPPIDWAPVGASRRGRWAVSIASGLAVTTLLLVSGLPHLLVGALPAGLLAAWAGAALMRHRLPPAIRTAGDLTLDGSNLVEYAVARRSGQRPEVMTASRRRGLICDRIDAVREEYARLAADIVFRINSPALFDIASSTTAAFENTLVRVADRRDDAPNDELDDLATELEIRFAVARDNAQRLGISHLPEPARDDARRAAKAAALAAGAATEGEREAALAQVVRILDSLALHYLPAPEAARRALTIGPTAPPR